MEIFERLESYGHEQVLFCNDPAAGYRSIMAIHSTALGPALGGTRVWSYASDADALEDALRLSRGMTYKNAVAGIPFGGAKAIVVVNAPIEDRELLFRAHGRFIHGLGGRFQTGEDVGTTPADMELVRLETPFVKGLTSGNGDPSPWTARGVFRAIQAAANRRWGIDDLGGRTVAIQGCGNVGFHLARELARVGARLVVADVDPDRVARLVAEVQASVVAPDRILEIQADVLSPCALGGVLNDTTIPTLRVEVVAGAANNQLLREADADALAQRGILYAPDFVANSGGVLSGAAEILGWSADELRARIDAIYDTMLRVFADASEYESTPEAAAIRLVDRRLARGTTD
jgi:leucine dehydrogenase